MLMKFYSSPRAEKIPSELFSQTPEEDGFHKYLKIDKLMNDDLLHQDGEMLYYTILPFLLIPVIH